MYNFDQQRKAVIKLFSFFSEKTSEIPPKPLISNKFHILSLLPRPFIPGCRTAITDEGGRLVCLTRKDHVQLPHAGHVSERILSIANLFLQVGHRDLRVPSRYS